ncbi:unnamed protein product [Mortierella alpina]
MPMFDGLFQPWRNALSPQQALKLAQLQLVAASNAEGDPITLLLCEQAESNLDRIKRPKSSGAIDDEEYQAFREEVAAAYSKHAKFMADWKYAEKALASRAKSEKWGGVPSPSQLATREQTPFPEDIFDADVARPTTVPDEMPQVNKQLTDTTQLTYCLAVLDAVATTPEVELPDTTRNWIQAIEKDRDEEKRLRALLKSLVRAFTRDELKDAEAVAEVTYMAPVLEKSDYRFLLKLFVNSLKDSALLEVHSLEGIARLLGSARPTVEADDLVRTLRHINANLQITHGQSEGHIYKLTTTVSRLLDAMADSRVEGIERENLHQPLCDYLEGLKGSNDPYQVFQAAYAFQALLCVPNNESPWEATQRRAGRIINGAFQLVGAVKALDVNSFIDGLCTLQSGLGEIYNVAVTIKDVYSEVQSLRSSGGELKAALQDISFGRKRTWYSALRGADTLLRNGQLAAFKKLVCEAPCRRALAFQWGLCLRLGNLAIDPQWGDKHRKDAVAFLGHLYRDDEYWGHHVPVKQLILDILIQLSQSTQSEAQAAAETLLKTLQEDDNSAKRAMLLACLKAGPSPHPLMAALPPPLSSALLDRAQGKVDVEADLKRLRLACEQRRVKAVYIAPMAKASLQSPDTDLFDLKQKADDFLASEKQKVLLLLGESGVGKSTFNMELEYRLWDQYEKHKGRIPLFINLPAVVRPEKDLIVKQLRKLQFEESQIRELKKRKFVLICDGYDESQQTHNLYASNRLNQEEEWQAQMVISCRSEYVGVDYKDRFQPGDRNQSSVPGQFQEAVVMPFNEVQIEDYIKNFVDLEQPLWSAENYSNVLKEIHSLRDLVKNPFLLKLSLDVLPRLVGPDQKDLAAAKVTRVALYDQFVEQWLERGKKRLVDKDLSEQERRAFETLSDEGFAQQGITYLKRLAADVYNKQGGNPVIEYSRGEDAGSWKHEYFSRDDHIQLLRDACPLTRSGNQYRFIHRSILEYGVARAVFEPQCGVIDAEKTELSSAISKRRCSVGSEYSFEIEGALQDNAVSTEPGPDLKSPVALRSFVGEPSVLQFLEERAQQEPVFRKLLHAYIHASKDDKKWRIAAANAITILVRAGEQFNGVDLQGIQIPGADLSFGMFDSAQLQRADLRKVKLSNVWLGKTNLSEAKMSGVEFGELPYLQEAGAVSRCVYSPDGRTLMTVLKAGGASVYSTITWATKWRIDHDVHIDSRVAFLPKNDLIVSFITIPSTLGSEMKTNSHLASKNETSAVYVWETETGHCRLLRGHTAQVTNIACSPNDDLTASCSEDRSIRLWNTTTNTCSRSLDIGDEAPAVSIAFSPKGDRLASAHITGPSRLWNLKTGTASSPLGARTGCMSVIYSPAGTKIACCGNQVPSMWDVPSGLVSYGWLVVGWNLDEQHMSLVFSPRGDTFANFGGGGPVTIEETERRTKRFSLKSSDGCLDAAFSPKGDLIVTGGKGQIVQLWDVDSGVCRGSMSGHSGTIRSVTFSPDGRHIASCGDDSRVRLWKVEAGMTLANSSSLDHTLVSAGHSLLGDRIFSVHGGDSMYVWDMRTGARLQSLAKPKEQIQSIALSPGGDQIASGTMAGNTFLLDLNDVGSFRKFRRTALYILSRCDSRAVKSIAYSPNGHLIASGSRLAVKLWDADREIPCHEFPGYSDIPTAITYSPTSDQFVSISEQSKIVRLWDVKLCMCRKLQGHDGFITSIAYSPKGDELATASDDMTVRLWNTASRLCRLTLSGHKDKVNQVYYAPNGDEIASCSKDCTVRLWRAMTGECRLVLNCAAESGSGVLDIAYSPAGNIIVSADSHSKMQLWNVETGMCMSTLQNDVDETPKVMRAVPSIRFSPEGELVAISSACSKEEDENSLFWKREFWDAATGESRHMFEDLPTGLVPVFSPDGSRIAYPDTITTVRVRDIETEICLLTLRHEDRIHDLQYSATGDLIASASADRTAKIWDAESGVCLHTIQTNQSGFLHLAFSPKGDRLVLATADGSPCVWDIRSETLRRCFDGHEGAVNCVVFSPNNRLLASGSDDTAVCLWDLTTRSPWRVFEGHTDSVQCVVFSPTGNHVVSGSKDKSIRVWDVEAGTCNKTLPSAGGEVWCLAYSPDGNLLASGTSNMSLYLWDVASGDSWAVIEGTYGNVTSIAWRGTDDTSYLITGCSDSSVRVWRVSQKEGKLCDVNLHWSSSHRVLFAAGCDLQGVQGLTETNKRLLMQCGAFGTPQPRKSFKAVSAAVLATTCRQQLNQKAMSSEE